VTFAALTTRLWLAAARTTAPPGSLGPVDQDPQQVREQACRIVTSNDAACTPATTTPPKSNDGVSFDMSWLSALLWLLLIVGLVVLLIMIVRLVASGSRPRRRSSAETDDDVDDVELHAAAVDRSREPVDWRAAADMHRREGRFREALRCRYRALVGDLARRGLIDEIPGRTTGEERAQMREVRPVAAPPFDAAADLFDDAWYGNVAMEASDDDRFQSLERDVLGAATGDRR
jgi:hypothetical protein